MSICLNITPNLHLSLELLEEVNKNWSLAVDTGNLPNKTAKKKAILDKVKEVLPFQPYIKVFLVRKGVDIYPIPGSQPEKASKNSISGITTLINKAKQNPASIPSFVNDINTKKAGDRIVADYFNKINRGDSITIPAIMSLDERTVEAVDGSISDTLLSSMESLSFDVKEESDIEMTQTLQDQTVNIEEPAKSNANQTVQVNQFDVKTKSELPRFDPNKTTTEGWIGSSVFALELGGVTEPKKIVSHLMLALDSKLQPSVQALIKKDVESSTPNKTISVEIFKKALKAVAGKSSNDLDTIVENLSFNRGHYKSMREFYIDLEQYIKDLNPEIENDTALAKIVSRAFKKKVPVEIRTAPAFQMSDETGVKLADLAQTLYSNLKPSSSCVNSFKASKPFVKKKVTVRNQNPRFAERGTLRRNRPISPLRCFYCLKLGHRKSECRKMKNDMRSRGNGRQTMRK